MNPVAKRIVTALTVAAGVAAAVLYAPTAAFPLAVGVLVALALMEFYQLTWRKMGKFSQDMLMVLLPGTFFIVGGLWSLSVIGTTYGSEMLLYVVAIVKLSDMGGFAFGMSSARLMKGGNHKLCPSISPGKSWEGLAGSVVASVLMSWWLQGVTGFGMGKTVVFGVVAAVVGTAGDLVESKFKRWVGAKDSSTMKITNGMGGFLDMLDSLLIAPSVLLAMI